MTRFSLLAQFGLWCIALATLSCATEEPSSEADAPYPIIPKPARLEARNGTFRLDADTPLRLDAQAPDSLQSVADYLSDWLTRTRKVALAPGAEGAGIELTLDASIDGHEAYSLDISPEGIRIRGGGGAGLFYGVQSLLQLIDPAGSGPAELPAVYIEDAPRFGYRGLMLDVGRHFFPVDFIKKYIDLLAQYKMNTFHWHLTEDQGWRIEIKRYPKLQEVAAYREETLLGHYNDQPHQFDGERYGGYYTQAEVREIVAYAADRYVRVIPEIELPGHARAAIAAYPELGCTGEAIGVGKIWGVHEHIYCPSEETFAFLEGVLTEVMELFPSKYIHIGGDEAPKTQWENSALAQSVMRREGLADEHELQSYFIQRIESFLNANGRQIIGWDEILEGGLAPNATVMSWRGIEGGIEAARQGHDVIMSPTSHMYFDYYQSDAPDEPLAIGGFLPLEKVYSYEPVPEVLSPEEARHILGLQGNLWTEYIPTPEKAEYMAYPRALAVAEIGWTPADRRRLDDFVRRLRVQIPRLHELGVEAANKLYDLTAHITPDPGGGMRVDFQNLAGAGQVRYTTDGSAPGPASPPAEGPVSMRESGTLQARTFVDGQPLGRAARVAFQMHKATGKTIDLTHQPAAAYNAGGPAALVNGVAGSPDRYGDSEWLGFSGNDLEAVIDLGEPTTINRIEFRFFNGPGQWIYPPRRLLAQVSDDGQSWTPAGERALDPAAAEGKLVEAGLDTGSARGRYLKVVAERFGEIPAGLQGAGHEAWLFVDEITVH